MLEADLDFTEVHDIDDLQCLERGDLVKVIFQYEPTWKYGEVEQNSAYRGLYLNGALEFVVPMKGKEEYLIVHRQRKSEIEFKDGAVVLNEDKSSTESYTQDEGVYRHLNETLELAGLR